jgi:hypothetical protein
VKLHLTYSSERTFVRVLGEQIQVKPYQIIIWFSIGTQEILEWDAKVPKLPAILDIGHNHNLSIQIEQLVKWAGIQPESLPARGTIREKGQQIPLRSAAFWLHADTGPFPLNMDEGIALYQKDGPRLPLLGLRALTNNKIQALVYGDQKKCLIRTPARWYWPF